MPCYPSTGRGGMALVSNRDVCVRAHEEVAVSTGVAFHMPYMLVGMITDAGCLPHTDVRTDIVDFDDSESFVNVRLIYRPPPPLSESEPMLHIARGQPLAMLTILPIGRPGLRAVRLSMPTRGMRRRGGGGAACNRTRRGRCARSSPSTLGQRRRRGSRAP